MIACWQRPATHNRRRIVLLVRQPTPHPASSSQHPVGRAACSLHDEAVRIYVSLLMRPWVMQACHSIASCHLDTTCTLRMLERFYCWIGMNILHPVKASPLPGMSSTTRSGEDHRTPIGSRSSWGHRGDVRDTLDGSRRSWEREMDLQLYLHDILRYVLGRDSESAPPNQPSVPPDANWCCTTGTFSE